MLVRAVVAVAGFWAVTPASVAAQTIRLAVDLDAAVSGVQNTRSVTVGDTFALDIVMSAGPALVAGYDLRLVFDPASLRLVRLSRQGPFAGPVSYDLQDTVAGGVARHATTHLGTGVNADGAVLRATFEAVGRGSVAVSVAGIVSGASGARFGVTTTPAALTVNAAGGPVFAIQPNARTVTAGQNASFTSSATGTPAPALRWQTSGDGGASWTDLAEVPPYSGTQTGSLTVEKAPVSLNAYLFRAVATNTAGTASSLPAALHVRGITTASPAKLAFAATKDGAVLTAVTAPQTLAVTFTGAPSAWKATSDQPWLHLTIAAGQGPGVIVAEIANPNDVLGASRTVTATVTIAAETSATPSIAVPVTLVVRQATDSGAPPFGQVDTPSQNATGVVGAIGVTGWALDDVGVSRVSVYRNCLAFEPQVNCQTIQSHRVVFVGNAAFLGDARPDVAAAFPSFPMASRAGWGYLMLTSLLPHVPAQQATGGQGPLTIYVFATDVEGTVTLLGRQQADHTPTSISLANDTIAKPFGAIDTPAQGETVSGTIHNFGWALTPDVNLTAGDGDILIPENGATAVVFIDGQPVAQVAYNQCRGSVGNPVSNGIFCNDDVANAFGNQTPQAPLAVRTANPTRHRNLDAGRGAIGAYTIDTTRLANGRHPIAWSVTDSAGRTEGIGSRFFNVLNSAVDAREPVEPSIVHRSTPSSSSRLAVRTGFDLNAPYHQLSAADDGSYVIEIPQLNRVEIELGAVGSSHLVVGGQLRALPAGASVRAGAFAWAPPAGYLGEYLFRFDGGGMSRLVRIRITVR